MSNETNSRLLSNATYDRLMTSALVVLPALSVLYFTLGSIWGFPEPEKVMGTVAALETFLGVLLKWSKSRYKNDLDNYDGGLFEVETVGGGTAFVFESNKDVDLRSMEQITARVVSKK